VVIAFRVQALLMLSLRWIDPPTTAFMAANPDGTIQQSVPVEHVSRNLLAAVIAHEDQALSYRDGAFDWLDMFSRATAHLRGGEDPSGSTIPQQVAENSVLTAACSSSTSTTRNSARRSTASARPPGTTSIPRRPRSPSARPCSWSACCPPPAACGARPGGGLDFQVDDGLGWLSRSHVINAQNRVPRHLEEKGFTPVEDAGVEGLAQDQPASDDDCSEMPKDVAELIATEGTA
jgi:monofunctional biosynthetic peptidoglycan transglycosylase